MRWTPLHGILKYTVVGVLLCRRSRKSTV